ncbi:hypothetical protein V8C44DRAFT_320228 [Trichoderma aethiopicum]
MRLQGPPIAWAENRATARRRWLLRPARLAGLAGEALVILLCFSVRSSPAFPLGAPHARFGAFSRGRRLESSRVGKGKSPVSPWPSGSSRASHCRGRPSQVSALAAACGRRFASLHA